MEVLGIIAILLLIALFALFLFIPTLAMIWGMAWTSKASFSRKNRWIRWGGILVILVAIPQVMNAFIESNVRKLLSQNHGEVPHEISARILAVESYNRGKSARRGKSGLLGCNKDCITLLLSKKVEAYLTVRGSSGSANLEVTKFTFENNSDCSYMNDANISSLSAKLEITIRELSLSGMCVVSRESTLDTADTLISYDKVESSSWFMPQLTGTQISVSQRHQNSGVWTEIYKDIGVRYKRVYPILLPAFTLDKKRSPIDVVRRTVYQSKNRKAVCRNDWFSDYAPCFRQLRQETPSKILSISASEYNLEKLGLIASKPERTVILNKIAETIILEARYPSLNEWKLLNRHVSSEYYENDEFASLVIMLMSHDNFPVPRVYFGIEKFNESQQTLFAAAVVRRMSKDEPGPEIGDYIEKRQWQTLYRTLEKLPMNIIEPHFDEIVIATTKRPYEKRYVKFLEKFGPQSKQPILELIRADKKRLKSLTSVMCKLGGDLSGIGAPLIEMANNQDIKIKGQLVYFLLDQGVHEEALLNTVNTSSMFAARDTRSIENSIERYKAGKTRCR